jgi:hypothetical protein
MLVSYKTALLMPEKIFKKNFDAVGHCLRVIAVNTIHIDIAELV